MSKRLQVILPEADMRQIQYFAQADKLTVAEWVRRAIIAAQRAEPTGAAAHKLGAVREALRGGAAADGSAGGAGLRAAANPFAQAFPTADMSRLLADIERGYRITAP